MGAWLPEAFIPTQGFQGWPWDIHCGCKTVDNMALLVIYCLLGIVACRPTKAGITALRNKAIRVPLPLFDFGSISYIIVCSDSNAGNLSSGQSPLSAVTREAWKDVFLRILEDSLKTIQCENPTWHTPGFLRKLQLAAGEKKIRCFLSLFFFNASQFSTCFFCDVQALQWGRSGEKNGSLKATSGMSITRDNELEHASLPFFLQRSWTRNSVVHAWKFYKHYLNSSQRTFASSGLLLPL